MMIGQRRSPWDQMGMEPSPVALDVPQVVLPQAAPQASRPKVNWAGILADALSGAMGRPGQYAAMNNQQRAEQTDFERGEQRYQRQRADAQADWQMRQQWERDNPAPASDQFSRYMDMANIPPEQRAALYAQRVNSMANPPRYMTGPNGEIIQIGGQVPAPSVAPKPVGKLRPLGGPMQPASGNFR